jgi:hypothetical protein
MQLDYAILADRATLTHDKKLVVFGGDIDSATVQELPAVLQATLVARTVLDVGESQEGHTFGLECTSASGKRQTIADNKPLNITRESEPEKPAASRLILELMFVVDHPGTHRFHLLLDGHEVKTLPFRVHVAPKAEG